MPVTALCDARFLAEEMVVRPDHEVGDAGRYRARAAGACVVLGGAARCHLPHAPVPVGGGFEARETGQHSLEVEVLAVLGARI